MTVIMGIDPGISGAIAFYHTVVSRVAVADMPVVGREVNAAELARMIRINQPDFAVLESVHSMPRDGGASAFSFGRNYGDVRGVIGALGVRLYFVTPQKWKKHFSLTSDKEQSRLRAIRMFPAVAESFKLKKHDGRAEAALIALYGAEVLDRGEAA